MNIGPLTPGQAWALYKVMELWSDSGNRKALGLFVSGEAMIGLDADTGELRVVPARGGVEGL